MYTHTYKLKKIESFVVQSVDSVKSDTPATVVMQQRCPNNLLSSKTCSSVAKGSCKENQELRSAFPSPGSCPCLSHTTAMPLPGRMGFSVLGRPCPSSLGHSEVLQA